MPDKIWILVSDFRTRDPRHNQACEQALDAVGAEHVSRIYRQLYDDRYTLLLDADGWIRAAIYPQRDTMPSSYAVDLFEPGRRKLGDSSQ